MTMVNSGFKGLRIFAIYDQEYLRYVLCILDIVGSGIDNQGDIDFYTQLTSF